MNYLIFRINLIDLIQSLEQFEKLKDYQMIFDREFFLQKIHQDGNIRSIKLFDAILSQL